MNPFLAALWGSLGSLSVAACLYCAAELREMADTSAKTRRPRERPRRTKPKAREARQRYFIVIALLAGVSAATAACLAASGEIKTPALAIGVGFTPRTFLRLPIKSIVLTAISLVQPRLGDVDMGDGHSTPEPISVGGAEAEKQ